MTAGTIVVIGDSHASFFGREDCVAAPFPAEPVVAGRFHVHNVGPGLAASLVERESVNRTRAKALEVLVRYDPASVDAVLFCFGEIDCRFHIVRRLGLEAPGDPQRLRESIGVTVYRYMSFLLEVRARGFAPVAWGPVATSTGDWPPPYRWPTLGSMAERNAITVLFTGMLGERCAEWDLPMASVLRSLVDADLNTRPEWYFDGVHLGQSAWPLFVAEAARTIRHLAIA